MNNGYFLSHLFQLSNRRWADEADLAVALSNRNDAVLDLKLVWRKPSVRDDTREFISGFEYGADDYVSALYRQNLAPPYEAHSVIIQAASGCNYHKCRFCNLYKKELPAFEPTGNLDESTAEEIIELLKNGA